jgi:hypothetical protein
LLKRSRCSTWIGSLLLAKIRLYIDKLSSLFCRSIGEKEKSFITLTLVVTNVKPFFYLSPTKRPNKIECLSTANHISIGQQLHASLSKCSLYSGVLLGLFSNIRQGWEGLLGTNTLAYWRLCHWQRKTYYGNDTRGCIVKLLPSQSIQSHKM